MNDRRPKFLRSYLDAVGKETDLRGWRAIVPWWLIGAATISGGIAYLMPSEFWENRHWDVSTAVYAGLLTFNGLVLALGWNAFARMYDVLLRGEFAKYLMRNGMLNDYILTITFIHTFQVIAVFASGVGLVSVLIDEVPLVADRIIIGAALTFTIYSVKQAVDAVIAMHDLVWQAAFFETHRPQEDNNVVPLGERG